MSKCPVKSAILDQGVRVAIERSPLFVPLCDQQLIIRQKKTRTKGFMKSSRERGRARAVKEKRRRENCNWIQDEGQTPVGTVPWPPNHRSQLCSLFALMHSSFFFVVTSGLPHSKVVRVKRIGHSPPPMLLTYTYLCSRAVLPS